MTGAVYYLNCVLIKIIFWSSSRSGRKSTASVALEVADLEKGTLVVSKKDVVMWIKRWTLNLFYVAISRVRDVCTVLIILFR